jgi:hypothetical protein
MTAVYYIGHVPVNWGTVVSRRCKPASNTVVVTAAAAAAGHGRIIGISCDN